jgi:hypothetical protein
MMQKKSTQKNRAGRVMVAGFFTPEVHGALKIRAVEQRTTIQGLLEQSISDLLDKRPERPVNHAALSRISLNLSVPRNLSKDAENHLLSAVEDFEKSNNVAAVDLDMTITPLVPRL